MISKVKGKTEVSRQPSGCLRWLCLLPFFQANLFKSLLVVRQTDPATRHPFAVSRDIPLHGRLSLGQPAGLETL